MVQVASRRWNKNIKGNLSFREVKSEIRRFIQSDLNSMDLKKFPNRPESRINLSLGDPTTSERFRTDPSNLQITAEVTKRQEQEADYHLQGIEEARKAVSNKHAAKAFQITEQDVYITAGGCWSLFAVARLLCNPGDNFLFPIPSFPYLLTIAQSNNFQVKFYNVRSEQNWEGDLEEMEALIDQKTRFIVVNDPSNPLGSCWSNDYKRKIIQLCGKHKIPLLADQIYEGITCDRSLLGFAEVAQNSEVPIFKCSGLSKQYSVPGWRVGWLIVYASKEIQKVVNQHLNKIMLMFPPTNMIAQASIAPIVNNPLNKASMEMKIGLIQENLITLNQTLRSLATHFQETKSAGAIYTAISVNVDSFNNEITDVYDFCKQLYAEENIVILPGTLFGSKSQFVRLLTSTDHNTIINFCERLKNFCRKYKQ